MIPATARATNVGGYSLDVTPWSDQSKIWIKMEAWTPKLTDNSIFEMYTAIQDTWDTSRTMFDSVKCSVEYKASKEGKNPDNPASYLVLDFMT